MESPNTWLDILALTKALFDATKGGIDVMDSFRRHRAERDTIQESERVGVTFASTYSDDEVAALLGLLEGCRDRFIAQGGGKARKECICSVLREAKAGNGGTLPRIDDWFAIFDQLGCAD